MSKDEKILVLNIATDSKDTSLGFAISWLNEFSKNYHEVDVITLNKGDTSAPVSYTHLTLPTILLV